jgi:prenyltransferase beta subunit
MGAAFAAIALGTAARMSPDKAAVLEPATRKVTGFLSRSLAASSGLRLHEKALVLWASTRLDGIADGEKRKALARDLLRAEQPDGSWSLAALVGRAPAREGQAYATGLALLALCESHATEEKDAIARAVTWLTAQQQGDGAFRARSINRDAPRNHEYMSDAATAYAVMALRSCAR